MAGLGERVELDRPWELGELIGAAGGLLRRHFDLFFVLALIVVTPYVIGVDGVWGRQLADGVDAVAPAGQQEWSALLLIAVVQPLITAMHARVVLHLGERRLPGVGGALREGLSVFLPAAAAVVLAALLTAIGFLLLVVPGIWLLVRLSVAAQAVVVEGRRGPDALARSAHVVLGRWWSTLGRLLALQITGALLGLVTGYVIAAIGAAAGSPLVYVVGQVLGDAVALSFTALASTLLFFDRRARAVAPVE
jgi:hypothetical protein